MSYELKKAEGRLENIQKVKPILAALRTISLGSWQTARTRRAGLASYTDRLLALLRLLIPFVAGQRSRVRGGKIGSAVSSGRLFVLAIGSEHGLCGRYSKAVIEELDVHLRERVAGQEVELGALGTRLVRELIQSGHEPTWHQALSMTALPRYSFAYDLASDWLQRYEAGELDGVDVVYNADRGSGNYVPRTVRLIPPEFPETTVRPQQVSDPVAARMAPDPIVETDPMRLYIRIVEQLTAISLYRLLLEGALTEHSTRYQLMESATQNADDLAAELMLTVNSARRQAITREMQELAVSAGLLRQ